MARACGPAAHTPLLALRGAGSKLVRPVKKKAKIAAAESAPSSEVDSGSFWGGEQVSRRADSKSFQAKARALIEREDGPLQKKEDSDDESGQATEMDDFDFNKFVTEGSLDAVWAGTKEGPKKLSEADSVGCACSLQQIMQMSVRASASTGASARVTLHCISLGTRATGT